MFVNMTIYVYTVKQYTIKYVVESLNQYIYIHIIYYIGVYINNLMIRRNI